MSQNISKGYKALICEANASVDVMSIKDAKIAALGEQFVFIDLRDFRELQREGKIPGAFSCPRGMLEFWIDPDSPYHKEIFNQNKTYVFYCASAWRSALSAKAASEMGLSPVTHIDGGFSAWVESGGDVEITKKQRGDTGKP